MNSSKRERREDQLMKKAEKLAEYASEIVMQSDTQMLIDGHPYVLVKNYRDGFRPNMTISLEIGDTISSGCAVFTNQEAKRGHHRKTLTA